MSAALLRRETFCTCGHEHLVNARTNEIDPRCSVCGDECPGFNARGKRRKRTPVDVVGRGTTDDGLEGVRVTAQQLAQKAHEMGRLAAALVLSIDKIRTSRRDRAATHAVKANVGNVLAAPLHEIAYAAANGMRAPTVSSGRHLHIEGGKMHHAGIKQGPHEVLKHVAAFHPDSVTRSQLRLLSDYSTRTITDYLSKLRGLGFIEAGVIRATKVGIAFLGSDYRKRKSGAALRAELLRELPEGEAVLFEMMLRAKAEGAQLPSREQLARASTYSTRTVTDYLGKLRARQVIKGQGASMQLAADLFHEDEGT